MEYFSELAKPTDILVIGNGFDLHCGLKSSFKNFFDSELRIGSSLNAKKIKDNLWYLIFTFAFMLDKDNGGDVVPYVNNKNPLWMDVESYIDLVFKSDKNLMSRLKIHNFILNALNSELSMDEESDYINGDRKNQRFHLKNRVWKIKNSKGFTKVEDFLFYDLNRFENDFANYLKKEITTKKESYEKNVENFILNTLDNYGSNNIYLLSFNYSRSFYNSIDEKNIINVHGSLKDNNIIIGIGDYEQGGLSGRENFKKDKRRIKNNLGSLKLPPKEDIKSIMFYGCSFSEQDWNYYKLIFKRYELGINSNLVLKFLYSIFGSNEIEKENNKDKYFRACESVVNSYLKDNHLNNSFVELCGTGEIEFSPIE